LKTWQKALLSTLITLAIGGVYLFIVWKHRQDPGVASNNQEAQSTNMDDYVVMRTLSAQYFEDLQKLVNTTVWMKNGYTMTYFPYEGGRVEFAHPVGVIPSAQRLDIKKVIKSAVPDSVDDGISHGSMQAFAIFALPDSPKLYAVAVGAIDGTEEAYFCDILFFYDDPHTIYSHWPKDVWAAVDARQVKPGMSELETRMAIGQKTHSSSHEEGNRTVDYDQAGKHWTITYENDRATAVKQD
jgi:hypothetical protein